MAPYLSLHIMRSTGEEEPTREIIYEMTSLGSLVMKHSSLLVITMTSTILNRFGKTQSSTIGTLQKFRTTSFRRLHVMMLEYTSIYYICEFQCLGLCSHVIPKKKLAIFIHRLKKILSHTVMFIHVINYNL